MKKVAILAFTVISTILVTGCANSIRGSEGTVTARTERFFPNGTPLAEVQQELRTRYPKLSKEQLTPLTPPHLIKSINREASYILSANLGSYRGGPLFIHTDVAVIFYFDSGKKLIGRKIHVWHDFL